MRLEALSNESGGFITRTQETNSCQALIGIIFSARSGEGMDPSYQLVILTLKTVTLWFKAV